MIRSITPLTNEIESSIGFRISNRRHCEILSELIYIKTGESISYNTIRRIFGISMGGNPSTNSLNILSKFLGYSSYSKYLAEYRTKDLWDVYQQVYHLLNDYPHLAIEKMENSFINVDEYLNLLISTLREFSFKRQFDLIERFFNSTLTDPKRFNYSQLLIFGNCVGDIFKNEQLNILDYTHLKNFKECYFKIYIDYSSLNSQYGILLDFYNENYEDPELKLFCNCLIQLKNYLNCKRLNVVETKLKFENIHPILYGRFMSIYIQTIPNSDEIISSFFGKIRLNENAIEYLYEFTFFNILSRNFKLLESTKNYVNKNISIPQYQEYHHSIFTLVDGVLSLLKGHKCNGIIQELKEMTFFRNSKRDIIDLFISILEFHNFSQSTQAYNNYIYKSNILGYKRFDINYLINYFKT